MLIGIDYWKPFVQWIHESALKNGLIRQADAQLFIVTDDIDEAYRLLKAHAESKPFSVFSEQENT